MALDKTEIANLAQKYQAKGQIDKAIQEWERVLQINPNDSNTHNTLGDLFLKKNDKTRAIAAYFKAANLFRDSGFTPKAMALYKKVLNLDPMSTPALLALAELNGERGLIGSANENYLSAAEIYVKENVVDKALPIYEKVMHLSKDNLPLHLKIAELYGSISLPAESAKIYLRCANICLKKNLPERAVAYFEKGMELQPQESAGYVGLCGLYRQRGQHTEALALLERAEAHGAGSETVLAAKASVLLELGRMDDALAVIVPLAESHPDLPEPFSLLVDALVRAGRPEEAWSRITARVEALGGKARGTPALEALALAESLPGRMPDILRLKALVYAETGQAAERVQTLKELVHCLRDMGAREEALQVVNEAKELAPSDVELTTLHVDLAEPERDSVEIEVSTGTGIGHEVTIDDSGEMSAEDFLKSLEKDLSHGGPESGYRNIELERGEEPEEQETDTYEIPDTGLDLTLLKDLGGPGLEEEPDEEAIEGTPEISIDTEEMGRDSMAGVGFEEPPVEESHAAAPPTVEEVAAEKPAPDKFDEDLAEGDFYLQQGLRDEAIEIFQNLRQQYPGRREVEERLLRLFPPPPPPPPSPEKPGKKHAQAISEGARAGKPEPVTDSAQREMANIFDAFKKVVESEVDEGDFETHYNLGIAYKEMGLTDDAIKEFEVALRVQENSVQGRSMLAMCLTESGQHEKAVSEYRRLLKVLDNQDDRWLAVSYDFGTALEMSGDRRAAGEVFAALAGVDPSYRDVQIKLQQLQG